MLTSKTLTLQTRRFVAPLALVSAVFGCQCDDELVTFKGRLLGVLCDPQTGLPAPGVPFRIESDGVVVTSDTTDDDGNIAAGGLKDGAGTLIADFPSGERRLDVNPAGQLTTLFEDPACRDVPPGPGTGDVSGVVCNRHTGELVQGATITVVLNNGDTVEATTDDDGNFLLFDVPTGDYALIVSSDTYRRTYAIEVTEGETTTIPGDECGLPSLSTGLLSGQLCDPNGGGPNGGALAGADVLVFDSSGDQYLELTDDTGSFVVGPMAPGPARVHVTKDDVVIDLSAIVVAGGEASVTNGGDCVQLTCTDTVITVAPIEPPELLLVVDRSGSMNAAAPGYGTTRWLGVKDALVRVTDAVDDRIAFGLMLFPALGGESGCSAANVDVVPALDGASAIAAVLDDFDTEPLGATPTSSSLRAAQAYVTANPSTRARAVLLATDGAPNCNGDLNPSSCRCSTGDDQDCRDLAGSDPETGAETCLDDADAVAAVTDLAAAGVATYVVGVPGVENFSDVLNAMADAGGTALPGNNGFYLARDTATLDGAIRDIGRRLASCDVDVDGLDLLAAAQVNVAIDDDALVRDPDHVDGFDVVDSDTLTLFGAACDALATGGNVSISSCLLGGEQ